MSKRKAAELDLLPNPNPLKRRKVQDLPKANCITQYTDIWMTILQLLSPFQALVVGYADKNLYSMATKLLSSLNIKRYRLELKDDEAPGLVVYRIQAVDGKIEWVFHGRPCMDMRAHTFCIRDENLRLSNYLDEDDPFIEVDNWFGEIGEPNSYYIIDVKNKHDKQGTFIWFWEVIDLADFTCTIRAHYWDTDDPASLALMTRLGGLPSSLCNGEESIRIFTEQNEYLVFDISHPFDRFPVVATSGESFPSTAFGSSYVSKSKDDKRTAFLKICDYDYVNKKNRIKQAIPVKFLRNNHVEFKCVI